MHKATTSHDAFSDSRAFVVRHDREAPGTPLDAVLTTQAEDGPTFIRVGAACTDEQLREAWEGRMRFPGLTLKQLLDARDGRIQCSQVASVAMQAPN